MRLLPTQVPSAEPVPPPVILTEMAAYAALHALTHNETSRKPGCESIDGVLEVFEEIETVVRVTPAALAARVMQMSQTTTISLEHMLVAALDLVLEKTEPSEKEGDPPLIRYFNAAFAPLEGRAILDAIAHHGMQCTRSSKARPLTLDNAFASTGIIYAADVESAFTKDLASITAQKKEETPGLWSRILSVFSHMGKALNGRAKTPKLPETQPLSLPAPDAYRLSS